MKFRYYTVLDAFYIMLMTAFVVILSTAYRKVQYPELGFINFIFDNPLIVFTYLFLMLLADDTVLKKQNNQLLYFRAQARESFINAKYKSIYKLNILLNILFVGFLAYRTTDLTTDMMNSSRMICLFLGTIYIFQILMIIVDLINYPLHNTTLSIGLMLGFLLGTHFIIRFLVYRTFSLGYILAYAVYIQDPIIVVSCTISIMIVCKLIKEYAIYKFEKQDILYEAP